MLEESNFKTNRESLICLGALFCLLTLSAARDSILLTQYDVPIGIDGYYYVIQVESFLENGRFYYPTHTPVVLYLMSLLAMPTGSVVTAVKVTSIILHIALSLSLFVLMTSITKSMWKGLLASAISMVSVTHLIWMGEFLNQLGGLTFFFWGAACLAHKPKCNRWRLLAFSLFVVSIFCHKSIVFLMVVLLFLALLVHLLNSIRQSGSWLSLVKICAVIFFCVCLPLMAAAQQTISMPRQISETVLASPQIPIKSTAFEEKLSLLILAPLGLTLCLKREPAKLLRWKRYVIGVTALFTILFTLNPFLSHEEELMTISGRLDLLSYLQISVLLSGVACLLSSRTMALTVSLSIVSLLLLGNSILPMGLQQSFIARRKVLLSDLTSVRLVIPANSIIIAPHGDQFLSTYATGTPSQNSALTNGAQEKNVIWLLFEVPCRATETAILLSRRNNCSLLVPENYPLLVTDTEKSQIMAMNPHLKNAPVKVVNRVLAVKN